MTTTAVPAITSFTGEYEFLSNFSQAGGLPVEYRYQMRKAVLPGQADWIGSAPTPGEAKHRGRRVQCRSDWEDIKRAVMFDLVLDKFSSPALGARLVATRGRTLIEGNTWGDLYWGAVLIPPDICTFAPLPVSMQWPDWEGHIWTGRNWFGRILMMVRDVLDSQS